MKELWQDITSRNKYHGILWFRIGKEYTFIYLSDLNIPLKDIDIVYLGSREIIFLPLLLCIAGMYLIGKISTLRYLAREKNRKIWHCLSHLLLVKFFLYFFTLIQYQPRANKNRCIIWLNRIHPTWGCCVLEHVCSLLCSGFIHVCGNNAGAIPC